MAPRKASKKPADPDPLSPYLGPLLVRARGDMKQDIVAKKAGISDATLRKYEKGRLSVPNSKLKSICNVIGANADVILLEANTAMRSELLARLGLDPDLPLYDRREKRKAALKARHEAELQELELLLDSEDFLYLKQKQFLNRD